MSKIEKLMNKSFLERTISGIILVVIALITIIMGNDVLFVVITVTALIGLSELYKVYEVEKRLPGIVGYIGALGYFALIRTDNEELLLPMLLAVIMLAMGVFVFSFPKYKANQIMAVFFGIVYVCVMLSYVYRTRMLENGLYIVWLIFLCSWGCDTCAYLVGVMFGKHKMAPVLSPKKSVEGGIGGIAGAALLGLAYTMIFADKFTINNSMIMVPVMCGVAAMVSQIGDLAASGIKRNYDVKDYGKLIPGHGGILDRFDSVIFTAPIIYYFVMYL